MGKEKDYAYAIVGIVVLVALVGSMQLFWNPRVAIPSKVNLPSGENLGGYAATAKCTDSDGGKNYYTYGYVVYNRRDYYDACISSTVLSEKYCTNKNALGTVNFNCPYGCSNGACTSQPIGETDTCVFFNYFNHTNYCYSNKGNCTGYGLCTVDVAGTNGERITWYSNCLGNPATIIDGINDDIYFNCTS